MSYRAFIPQSQIITALWPVYFLCCHRQEVELAQMACNIPKWLSSSHSRWGSLRHHVHGRQHASRGLQWDVWNRFIVGWATCFEDDQVGDATCSQEVGWVIRWCGAEEPCLPVCCQVEPHFQVPRCVDGIGDGTVKSDWSVVVLCHFKLGRTIGFQTAVPPNTNYSPCHYLPVWCALLCSSASLALFRKSLKTELFMQLRSYIG